MVVYLDICQYCLFQVENIFLTSKTSRKMDIKMPIFYLWGDKFEMGKADDVSAIN